MGDAVSMMFGTVFPSQHLKKTNDCKIFVPTVVQYTGMDSGGRSRMYNECRYFTFSACPSVSKFVELVLGLIEAMDALTRATVARGHDNP